MLYQYYNFDDNFYNADGGGKREIVLSELSQLIANDPQAIRGALNQAGIQMDVSASPKKLQRTIFRHAKKKGRRGKKMIRNLSILIFAKTKIGEDKFDTFFKGKGGGGKIKRTFKFFIIQVQLARLLLLDLKHMLMEYLLTLDDMFAIEQVYQESLRHQVESNLNLLI